MEEWIYISPDTKILKAETYQEYITSKSILDEAHQQADEILSQQKLAYDIGYIRGVERAKRQEARQSLKRMLEALWTEASFFHNQKAPATAMASKALEKLLGSIENSERIEQEVQASLEEVQGRSFLELQVHQSVLEKTQEKLQALNKTLCVPSFFSVTAHHGIAYPSRCAIHCRFACIEGLLREMLKDLQTLVKELGS